MQERLNVSAENLKYLSHTCELCNEHGHLNLQCKLFHDRIISKNCDNHESGFGEVMTLFSDESTISEEVPIDYENKVAIYDDYCDYMYAIKNKDNHETCHHDFNFQLDYASHDSYIVEIHS